MRLRIPGRINLPQSKETDWIYGWKGANLLIHRMTHEIKFAPIYQYHDQAEPYGVEANAKCQSSMHRAPRRPVKLFPCQCGFNAYGEENLSHALNFLIPAPGRGYAMVTDNVVILWVGLSGLIYAGNVRGSEAKAARGAHQRVGLVLVPKACAEPDCFMEPASLSRLGPRPASKQLHEYDYLRPTCKAHEAQGCLSLERCSERLEVPYGEPKVQFEWYDPMTDYR